jgi:4-amino-4-deoxy-L-arabinose transferase-like glycosyltransferase
MNQRRWQAREQEWIWVWGLGGAALLLFGVQLGHLPLRDWDEGIVGQVAREMAQAPFTALVWLHPLDITGNPYFNKPPLMHWLVALSYTIGGINEWTTRLPGAVLTAGSVPLLYGVGREIFLQRLSALLAALVYLTWLPVVRLGRLAMLDGAVLCFFLLLLVCLLRSRRNLRWGLGVGLSLGLICLTKGILGLLLGAIAFLFIAWDTPRLLTSGYLWSGIGVGSIPVVAWYLAQWQHYGQAFLTAHLLSQSLERVWQNVDRNRGEPWFYLLDIVKYSGPWLLFLPPAVGFTWASRALSWAKLLLLWAGLYFVAISLMGTKLPWYGLPLYPALALMVGSYLASIWSWTLTDRKLACSMRQTRIWAVLLLWLALVAGAGAGYFGLKPTPEPDLAIIGAALALTLATAGVLVGRRDCQFMPILLWGTYITLLLLMMSDHWLWELAETYPAKPVGLMIRQNTPRHQSVYASHHRVAARPSLNFYSDRPVFAVSAPQLQQHWQAAEPPYLLVDAATLATLPTDRTRLVKVLGKAEGLLLITRQSPQPAAKIQRSQTRKSPAK